MQINLFNTLVTQICVKKEIFKKNLYILKAADDSTSIQSRITYDTVRVISPAS